MISSISLGRLTETERRLFEALRPGAPVPKADLQQLISDELSLTSLFVHVSNLREKLGHYGLDVVARGVNGRTTYRLVRHIGPGE